MANGNLNPPMNPNGLPVDPRFTNWGRTSIVPGSTSHPNDPNARFAGAVADNGNVNFNGPQQQGTNFNNARVDNGNQNFGAGAGGGGGGGGSYSNLWNLITGNAMGQSNMGWADRTNAANLIADQTYSQPGGVGAQLLRSNADVDIAGINSETQRYLADQRANTVMSLLPGVFGSLSNLAGGGGQYGQQGGGEGQQPTAQAPTLSNGSPWQALLQQMAQQGMG